MNIMKMSSLGKLNNVLVAGIVITMLIYIITSVVTGAFDTSSWVPFFHKVLSGTTGFLSAVPIAMTGYDLLLLYLLWYKKLRIQIKMFLELY